MDPSKFILFDWKGFRQVLALRRKPHHLHHHRMTGIVLLVSLCSLIALTACTTSESAQDSSTKEIILMTQTSSQPVPGDWWQPATGLTWQWQLDEEVDTSIEADVYDIDLYTDQSIIDELHARNIKVICYISVGSWEDWRPDASQFPPEVLGNKYEGWPGERWLDIRRLDLLSPIMANRLDLCKSKGFDAVEPDNIEIYNNPTGFPLSYQDQLAYASWLAEAAHARGLAIGLKNAPGMVADSISFFDFAITEDAFFYGWVAKMLPFIKANKPVFAAEYTDMDVNFPAACVWGAEHNVSFIQKNRILTAFRITCP
jgi:endo-alpha-1,4-polygalactosaminidase (GH114 family)